jgi:hypothetical protein
MINIKPESVTNKKKANYFLKVKGASSSEMSVAPTGLHGVTIHETTFCISVKT